MNFELIKATNDNIKIANKFLTQLINDEKKYDNNINEKCIVNSFYENFYNSANQFLYFAKVKDRYVGYIYGFVEDNGDAYLDKVTELDAMFVEEKYRNKGIGTSLIKKFQEWSKEKEAKYIELKVCNGNESAIALYKKNLFESIKIVMNYEIKD